MNPLAFTKNELLFLSISDFFGSFKEENCVKRHFEEYLKPELFIADMMVLLNNDDNLSQRIIINYTTRSRDTDSPAGYPFDKNAVPNQDGLIDKILSGGKPIVWSLEEIVKSGKAPGYVNFWFPFVFKKVIGIPIISEKQAIGVVFFTSENENAFEGTALGMLNALGQHLFMVILNLIAANRINRFKQEKSILIKINEASGFMSDKNSFDQQLNQHVQILFPGSHTVTLLSKKEPKKEPQKIADLNFWLNDSLVNRVLVTEKPVVFKLKELVYKSDTPKNIKLMFEKGMREVVFLRMAGDIANEGLLIVFTGETNIFNHDNLSFLEILAVVISCPLWANTAKEKSENSFNETWSTEEPPGPVYSDFLTENPAIPGWKGIIGKSEGMKYVFKQIKQVGETETTVLILGETGTGKELIAKAIHESSARRQKKMIKINCAVLPPNLIESELFGHEKGSFTGAVDRRIGKFELANNSTLFLDEIGELPLELQGKLLRVLQEREFERIGGNVTIKTNVRIIAATNRDLLKQVQLGNFRGDLYFRLNVFPLSIPSLRERKEDIPVLASYFLIKHAKKNGKSPQGFSSNLLKHMSVYNWPGNVRELEHLIEKNIILTDQGKIKHMDIPSMEFPEADSTSLNLTVKTIDEIEREYIISILKMCRGKVAGIAGAAKLLKIPSTTLNSKIKRLKIEKEYIDGKFNAG